MRNDEKRAALYKQELINVRSDLCDLEKLIRDGLNEVYIDLDTDNEILSTVQRIMKEINEIFPRVERFE